MDIRTKAKGKKQGSQEGSKQGSQKGETTGKANVLSLIIKNKTNEQKNVNSKCDSRFKFENDLINLDCINEGLN
jgi:flagellar biosynthesis/type III secretory pathway protein FliH